jgi:hypothetical protein
VLLEAEDGGAPVGLVTADALEDTKAVVEGMGEDVCSGPLPINELAVEPE